MRTDDIQMVTSLTVALFNCLYNERI